MSETQGTSGGGQGSSEIPGVSAEQMKFDQEELTRFVESLGLSPGMSIVAMLQANQFVQQIQRAGGITVALAPKERFFDMAIGSQNRQRILEVTRDRLGDPTAQARKQDIREMEE